MTDANPARSVPSRTGVWRAASDVALVAALVTLGACGSGRTAQLPVPEVPTFELVAPSGSLSVRVHHPEMGGLRATFRENSGAREIGRFALPGIAQIPRDALKLSYGDLRPLVLIADVEPDPDREHSHGELMRTAACGAYVVACADPNDLGNVPFSYFHPSADAGPDIRSQKLDKARELGSRIVSHSIGPFFSLLDAESDRYRGFALVQPTGNSGLDSVFAEGLWPVSFRDRLVPLRYDPFGEQLVESASGRSLDDLTPGSCAAVGDVLCHTQSTFGNLYMNAFRNIRHWIANDWVIYTAGYTLDDQGRPVRHPESNDCPGVAENCVWVTYSVYLSEIGHDEVSSGTSYGPPRVAMAMASMLSVYPDLSPTNLVFLTRACAKPVPTLAGNGIADFTCMLNIDENGVVSVKDHEDLGLPDVIPPIVLPGELAFSTRLVDLQGRESPFGKRIPSAPMAFRSGLEITNPGFSGGPPGGSPPRFELALGNGVGLFGIQESGRRLGTGLVWRRGDLFAAVGHAVRDRFFGFASGGGAWNFRGTREIGANAGHSNLYLRFTSQRTQGRAELAGKSLGITAEREFPLRGDWSLGVRAEADKFLGGRARIPGMDGAARIRPGDVGYRADIRLTRTF